MAQQYGASNKFAPTKGLITEASAIAFPQDAAVALDNVVIDAQGKVSRRLGIDIEQDGVFINKPFSKDNSVSTFLWRDAGGVANRDIRFTIFGKYLEVRYEGSTLSIAPIAMEMTIQATSSGMEKTYTNFTEAAGGVILTNERANPIYFYFDENGVFSSYIVKPKIRAINILKPNAVSSSDSKSSIRYPNDLKIEDEFNLRNTGWAWSVKGAPNAKGDGSTTIVDPVRYTKEKIGFYPSHIVSYHTLKLSSSEEPEPVGSFSPWEIEKQSFGNTTPPIGHYIHSAYEFNPKELMEEEVNYFLVNYKYTVPSNLSPWFAPGEWYPGLPIYNGFTTETGLRAATLITNSLRNSDNNWSTNNRPICAAFLNGHALYAELDRNNKARILVSQLVKETEDLSLCYQDADPTAEEINDIVDTDGWVMQPEGMGKPVSMIEMSKGIVLICTNGAWLINGSASFSATDYSIKSIATFDFNSPGSVVKADDAVILFAKQGIIALATDDFGELRATNVTQDTIQSLYRTYDEQTIRKATAAYDEQDSVIYWLIPTDSFLATSILCLNVKLGAFYTLSTSRMSEAPRLLAPMIRRSIYSDTEVEYLVTSSGERISTSYGEYVGNEITTLKSTSESIGFVCSNSSGYFYSDIFDNTFHDYVTLGDGYDYKSYIEFAYVYPQALIGGIQVPYIHSYFEKGRGINLFDSGDIPDIIEPVICENPIIPPVIDESNIVNLSVYERADNIDSPVIDYDTQSTLWSGVKFSNDGMLMFNIKYVSENNSELDSGFYIMCHQLLSPFDYSVGNSPVIHMSKIPASTQGNSSSVSDQYFREFTFSLVDDGSTIYINEIHSWSLNNINYKFYGNNIIFNKSDGFTFTGGGIVQDVFGSVGSTFEISTVCSMQFSRDGMTLYSVINIIDSPLIRVHKASIPFDVTTLTVLSSATLSSSVASDKPSGSYIDATNRILYITNFDFDRLVAINLSETLEIINSINKVTTINLPSYGLSVGSWSSCSDIYVDLINSKLILSAATNSSATYNTGSMAIMTVNLECDIDD